MAKKRKAAKPSSSAGSKKKTTGKKAAGKPGPKTPRGTAPSYKVVDFTPLKADIREYVARLEKAKAPSDQVKKAIETLLRASMELSEECLPTMILPIS